MRQIAGFLSLLAADDLKSSHVDPMVNDKFIVWLEKMYAPDPKVGKVKVVRGPVHNYLAMVLDYSQPDKSRDQHGRLHQVNGRRLQ